METSNHTEGDEGMPVMTWTGDNIMEMAEFARANNFSFSVGSNYDNWKWYHNWYAKIEDWFEFLPEWSPPEDMTILEVYPQDDDVENSWSIARVGDIVYSNGVVAHAPRKD